MGKQSFELSRSQVDVLKRATKENARGIVWFENVGISIPHIQSVELIKRNYFKIEENIKRRISLQEYEKHSKELKAT